MRAGPLVDLVDFVRPKLREFGAIAVGVDHKQIGNQATQPTGTCFLRSKSWDVHYCYQESTVITHINPPIFFKKGKILDNFSG